MTLLQLKYFQTLAYILHYTRASEALHISQPSLSYAISELEKELGFKLFEKENRKIVLTEYGKEFLPYVEKGLDILMEGAEKVKTHASQDGSTIHLGYFYSISTDFIPMIISKTYKSPALKKLTFNFCQEQGKNITNMLKNGQLDLGFTMHIDEELEVYPLFKQKLFLVVPNKHPLAHQDNITVQNFIKEPIIVLGKSSNLRSCVENIYAKAQAVPNIAFEITECNSTLQFVARGMGISILPRVAAVDVLPVKYLEVQDNGFERTIYLAWSKKRKLSQLAQELKDFIICNYK